MTGELRRDAAHLQLRPGSGAGGGRGHRRGRAAGRPARRVGAGRRRATADARLGAPAVGVGDQPGTADAAGHAPVCPSTDAASRRPEARRRFDLRKRN